ncbi:MAG: RNA polymerase sigma factor [Planctomycetota bacterium]
MLCAGNGRYRPDRADVRAHLLGIAENAITRHHQARTSQPKTVGLSLIDRAGGDRQLRDYRDHPTRSHRPGLQNVIEHALAKLPAKTREAVKLKHIEGLSSKEATEKTGCSVKVFYDRIHEAISSLRQLEGSHDTIA